MSDKHTPEEKFEEIKQTALTNNVQIRYSYIDKAVEERHRQIKKTDNAGNVIKTTIDTTTTSLPDGVPVIKFWISANHIFQRHAATSARRSAGKEIKGESCNPYKIFTIEEAKYVGQPGETPTYLVLPRHHISDPALTQFIAAALETMAQKKKHADGYNQEKLVIHLSDALGKKATFAPKKSEPQTFRITMPYEGSIDQKDEIDEHIRDQFKDFHCWFYIKKAEGKTPAHGVLTFDKTNYDKVEEVLAELPRDAMNLKYLSQNLQND